MTAIGLALSALGERARLKARERWSRDRLRSFQAAALGRLRRHAYTNSPFYSRFHAGLERAPLSALPVLTKQALMENFDNLVTDRGVRLADVKAFVAERRPGERYLGRYWVTSTSGTSGRPGLFLLDRGEWVLELATALRAFEWAGLRLGPMRQARVAQITSTNPSHLSTQGGRSMASWWMPTLVFDASEPLPSVVERLNAWRPEMLWAYASIIRALAEEQLAGRLEITPRSVLSASELLTPGIRELAVRAWGNVVFDTYATTDCGGLGAECEAHHGLHLMDDLAIVEPVDRNNAPVPPGVFADKLLVTVLGSRTQPLIRYTLDDSVRLSRDACPCGRPFRLIEAIQGRIEEVLTFPAVAGGEVAVHPIVFSNVMDALPLAGWQVLQDDRGLHLLVAGAAPNIDVPGLTRQVADALRSQGADVPPIEVRAVLSIPKAANGKTPLVARAR